MSSGYSSWWKRKILYHIPFLYKIGACGNYHPFWHRLCFCRMNEYSPDFHGGILDLKTGVEYHKDSELEMLRANIHTCSKCGNKYYAHSHEYPCPWCLLAKYEP